MAKVKKSAGSGKVRGMIMVICSKSDAPVVWANAAPGKADGHRCTKCGETGHATAKIK